jgi:hypothetical protein
VVGPPGPASGSPKRHQADAGAADQVGAEGEGPIGADGKTAPSKGCQEQTQMIRTVMGRAAPKAPPIIRANADSKFASACTSCLDIPLLHRAPAPWARWMRMVKKWLTPLRSVRLAQAPF